MTVFPFEELALEALPLHAGQKSRRLQVLVLEDDETDRLRLQRVLFHTGLDVELVEAHDMEMFQARLREAAYDIVFIDFWLGFDNGLDALDLLMAAPSQERAVPIMLSRATEPEVIVEAMRAGCADYIVKESLDVAALRGCIAAAFERRVLLAAMREGQELRRAIRRLVERLGKGQVPGLNEARAVYEPARKGRLSASAAKRLSAGLLADLELLWHLRRDQDPAA